MYHWIITLMWGGGSYGTLTGTALLGGKTRTEVYMGVLTEARRQTGAPADAAVMFFSLEPDDLPLTAHGPAGHPGEGDRLGQVPSNTTGGRDHEHYRARGHHRAGRGRAAGR
jgi:hypothetical protein